MIFFLLICASGFISGSKSRSSDFIKGMTVSCQTWGYEWTTPEMNATMVELKNLGANSISIHPYARVFENGQIKYRKNRQSHHIMTPISWGKELNIKIMIKPHLAYWRTKFRWRGDIDFENEQDWEVFFRDYCEWIVYIASIAEKGGAQIFCIGTELMNSLKYENEWRHIISEIRKVYSGKITYAANWDKYQQVLFWDALDYIGIQAYFPLVNNEIPSREQIILGWDRVYEQIIPFAESLNKRIIFTEIGYDISENAAREPWQSGSTDPAKGGYMQRLCLEIALDKAHKFNQMAGLFLWKWFPNTHRHAHHENYNLQRPEIKSLLKEMWKE
jgi:hypothetical protein